MPTTPTHRPTCGTRWGIAEHARTGETLCGACHTTNDIAALRHEARQPIPDRAEVPVQTVSTVVRDLQRVIALLAELMTDMPKQRRAA